VSFSARGQNELPGKLIRRKIDPIIMRLNTGKIASKIVNIYSFGGYGNLGT
jgi:hypothetical protein